METRPYRKLYWCISWDQARVEQLGVARPQRTAVFDATDGHPYPSKMPF